MEWIKVNRKRNKDIGQNGQHEKMPDKIKLREAKQAQF